MELLFSGATPRQSSQPQNSDRVLQSVYLSEICFELCFLISCVVEWFKIKTVNCYDGFDT